jgi:hypothetical protein
LRLTVNEDVVGSSPTWSAKHGDVMWEAVMTFLALFFTDIFYTYYLKAIQDERALSSSLWAVVVFLIAGFAVINYTTNHWMLIPACLGAFSGTYVGIKIRKKK